MRTIEVSRFSGVAILTVSPGLTAVLLPVPRDEGAGRLTIRPARLLSGAGFYVPSLLAGLVTVAPAALTGGAAVYPPRVVPAGSAILPPVLLPTSIFLAPSATPGGVAVTPAALLSGAAIYAPVVQAPAAGAILPPALGTAALLYPPVVQPAAVALQPSLLASASTAFAPAVQSVPAGAIQAPFLGAGSATYSPIVQPAAVAIQAVLLASTAAFYAPTVQSVAAGSIQPYALGSTILTPAPALVAGAVTVTAPALGSGAILYAPALQPGAATVAPAALASAASFYAPSVLPGVATITPPARASTAILPMPSIAAGAVAVVPALLASTAATFAPTVSVSAPAASYDLILVPTDSFGVGVQSREAGDTLASNVFQFSGNSNDPAYRTINQNLPLSQPIPRDANSYLSFAESMANAHAARTGNPTVIIPYSWNGTNLASNGHRWAVGDDLHEQAIAQANAAIAAAQAIYPGSKLVAIAAWDYGGANDAIQIAQQQANAATKALFKTALVNALADFRSRITGAANVPIVLGSLVPEMIAAYNQQNTVPYQSARDISDALAEVARDGTNIKFVDIQPGNSADNLHQTNAGLRITGPAFDAILAAATAPTIGTSATATVPDGSPVNITLTADKYVTWSLTGADAAAFEIVRTFGTGGTGNINSTVATYTLRLVGNTNASYTTKPSYAVTAVARDGAGNVKNRSIAIAVGTPYGVGDNGPITPVHIGGRYVFGSKSSPYTVPGGFNIKKGLNFLLARFDGVATQFDGVTANGIAAKPLARGSNLELWSVVSSADVAAAPVVITFPSGGSIGGGSFQMMAVTGTKRDPVSVDIQPVASRQNMSSASATVPANGALLALGQGPVNATGGAATTVLGRIDDATSYNYFSAVRTSSGSVNIIGTAANDTFMVTMLFEKSA